MNETCNACDAIGPTHPVTGYCPTCQQSSVPMPNWCSLCSAPTPADIQICAPCGSEMDDDDTTPAVRETPAGFVPDAICPAFDPCCERCVDSVAPTCPTCDAPMIISPSWDCDYVCFACDPAPCEDCDGIHTHQWDCATVIGGAK